MFLKKPLLVAEIGLAHDGSLGIAKSFAKIAKLNGADAVKFQHHQPIHESSKNERFRKKFSYQDKNRFEYWKRTSFSLSEWKHLKRYCDKIKIKFICSPFSIESVNDLNKVGLFAWKIASGEFTNILLIERILRTSNKPIILSTGLTTLDEIKEVISIIKASKNQLFSLLQCTSKYPTKINEVGHDMIEIYKKKFKCSAGISDHSGNLNSLLHALSIGADIIEFHLTLNRNFFGPDTSSSITPDELNFLSKFRNDLIKIKKTKTNKTKLNANQKKMIKLFSKSLYAKNKIEKNKKITLKNLKSLKPGTGIPVLDYKIVLNKIAKKIIKKNEQIKLKDLR